MGELSAWEKTCLRRKKIVAVAQDREDMGGSAGNHTAIFMGRNNLLHPAGKRVVKLPLLSGGIVLNFLPVWRETEKKRASQPSGEACISQKNPKKRKRALSLRAGNSLARERKTTTAVSVKGEYQILGRASPTTRRGRRLF